MRRRIKELSFGKVDTIRPLLQFSLDKIELLIAEEQSVTGEFHIQSGNKVKMRGLIYSSNPRMECLTKEFEGEEAVVRYKFHSTGLQEGDIQKGDFFIICNDNEYNLSFVVTISNSKLESAEGSIQNLKEFQHLAETHWEEALPIFSSQNFESLFSEKQKKEKILYRSLTQTAFPAHNMEEFLVGTGAKEKNRFTVEQTQVSYLDLTESRKEELVIKKQGYGELTLRIDTQGSGLSVPKTILTEEDFVGNEYHLEYYVVFEKLHAGRNFGKIQISTAFQQETVEFTLRKQGEVLLPERQEVRRQQGKLAERYFSYRLKKIDTQLWAQESQDILQHLKALEPENPWFDLYRAQIYLVKQQKQEAQWILDAFRGQNPEKESVVYGYYLYLSALANREDAYVDQVTERIEDLYRLLNNNKMLRFLLLFLKEEYYEDPDRRLLEMELAFLEGIQSPYYYLEAFYEYWTAPYRLTKLGEFEIQVLYFAAKRKVLTRDLVMQITSLVRGDTPFYGSLVKLLACCYELYPLEEVLQTICSYLVRYEKYEKKYFSWYEKGIQQGLRITGLNEAYLMTLDMDRLEELPKIIELYFKYNSSLPYPYLAKLFARIVKEKEERVELYEAYRRNMESFAMEQMQQQHINEDLAILYEDLLKQGFLNKEIAEAMAHVMFVHEVTTDCQDMTRVFCYYPELKQKIEGVFHKGKATLPIYNNNYVLIAEDLYGRRYSAYSAGLEVKRYMNAIPYVKKCLQYAPKELPYLLHLFSGKTKFHTFVEEDKEYLKSFMEKEELSNAFRAALCPELLRFAEEAEEPLIRQYLAEISWKDLPVQSRSYFISLLVDKRLYDVAYGYVTYFGPEEMEAEKLVNLCTYEIERKEGEEDDPLLSLCISAFRKGKYNESMLQYLCTYFEGSTKELSKLWEAAREFEVDTFALEERLLAQMLYARSFTSATQPMYEHFMASGGQELLHFAYLNYFSYQYFVKGVLISPSIFKELTEHYDNGEELSEICKLTLLKYYADDPVLVKEKEAVIDELLMEFTKQNLYFAFYKKFTTRLLQKYQLVDKLFLEYRTEPGKRIFLHYALSENPEEYHMEELQANFPGIYVKQFILFFGESIQYYLTEDTGDAATVVESNQISKLDSFGEKPDSRYDLLNEILLQITLKEGTNLKENLKKYEVQNRMVEEGFSILE